MFTDDPHGASGYPVIEVRHPAGTTETIELDGERVTVGRLPGVNDIVLAPDPERYVSGRWHCLVERDGRVWRVVDNGSTNGTFLRRDERMVEVRDAAALADGDVICILAVLGANTEPGYWELAFRHPTQTVRVEARPGAARLEYDWVSAQLFRITRDGREEIGELRPQVHHLLRYLLSRNRANGEVPVLCSHDELMQAVWEDEPLHTREELNGLIFELRRGVELDPKQPCFVQTVRGLGFRLDSRPSDQ